MPDRTPTLDLSFLKEFCLNDRKKMSLYIHTFLESAPEQIQLIIIAVTQERWKDAEQLAHGLKPQVTLIGLPVLQEWIEKIEQDAAHVAIGGNPSSLIIELNDAVDQATDALLKTLVTLS